MNSPGSHVYLCIVQDVFTRLRSAKRQQDQKAEPQIIYLQISSNTQSSASRYTQMPQAPYFTTKLSSLEHYNPVIEHFQGIHGLRKPKQCRNVLNLHGSSAAGSPGLRCVVERPVLRPSLPHWEQQELLPVGGQALSDHPQKNLGANGSCSLQWEQHQQRLHQICMKRRAHYFRPCLM